MKHNLRRKWLDIVVSVLLLLLLILSFIFRSSPMDFMNPGFPILRPGNLELSEKFFLASQAEPLRLTGVDNFSEVAYETTFQLKDTTPALSNFYGSQTLTRVSNAHKAEQALRDSYQEYIDYEGDFPIRITDIPLVGFSSEADHYLLWCAQYSHDFVFNAENIETCYYWATYGSYLSKIKLFMSSGRGFGRQFPIELFNEIITRAESKILSKVNTQ